MQRTRWVDAFLEVGIWVLFFALLIPAGVVGWAIGQRGGTKTVTVTVAAGAAPTTPIAAAPAFSASELAKDPTDNWITNGGSLTITRP